MINKLILAIIAFFCGLLVSGFNYLLNDKIQIAKKEKEMAIKKTFFPEAKTFEETEVGLLIAKKEDQTELGFLYYTEDSTGYSGKVKYLVSLNLDGTIKDFLMYEHNETPGLGTQVNDSWFRQGFVGKVPSLENMPTGKKDFKSKLGIDAISGATISSMATVKALTKNSEKYTQWCLERMVKKTESTYQLFDKNTYQNLNVIQKKKTQPIVQPVKPVFNTVKPVNLQKSNSLDPFQQIQPKNQQQPIKPK